MANVNEWIGWGGGGAGEKRRVIYEMKRSRAVVAVASLGVGLPSFRCEDTR